MPLTTSEMQRIMIEIDLGVPPEQSAVKGPEAEAFRRRTEAEIAEIKAGGRSINFTAELEPPGEETLGR